MRIIGVMIIMIRNNNNTGDNNRPAASGLMEFEFWTRHSSRTSDQGTKATDLCKIGIPEKESALSMSSAKRATNPTAALAKLRRFQRCAPGHAASDQAKA